MAPLVGVVGRRSVVQQPLDELQMFSTPRFRAIEAARDAESGLPETVDLSRIGSSLAKHFAQSQVAVSTCEVERAVQVSFVSYARIAACLEEKVDVVERGASRLALLVEAAAIYVAIRRTVHILPKEQRRGFRDTLLLLRGIL